MILPSPGLSPARYWWTVGGALLVCVAAAAVSPLIGPVPVNLWTALSDPASLDHQVLLRARLPRILFAAVTGGALSVSGVVFQAILRNPLASPFTLGISGGGSLGAVVAIVLGWDLSVGGLSLLPLSSFAGSLAIVLVVYGLSRTRRHLSPMTLLLSGVVLNYLCAAAILLIHYFSNFTKAFLMMRWMMGGLDVYEYSKLLSLTPFFLLGLPVLMAQSRYLNVLSTGEEWAATRGVNVNRLITTLYFCASLLTGSVVAFAGPIGFVGLVVPHLLRLTVGADHRLLLPVSFLFGGAFLIVCDTIARTVLAPTEIPVGIFTSLLGGPFFLWLLLRRKREFFL